MTKNILKAFVSIQFYMKKKQSEQKSRLSLKKKLFFSYFLGIYDYEISKSYHKILLTSNYCLINNLHRKTTNKTYVILRIQSSPSSSKN